MWSKGVRGGCRDHATGDELARQRLAKYFCSQTSSLRHSSSRLRKQSPEAHAPSTMIQMVPVLSCARLYYEDESKTSGTNLSRLFEAIPFSTSPLCIFQERHRERLIDLPADNWLLGSHCAHTFRFYVLRLCNVTIV